VLVVFGQRHDVALRCDLEPTAAAHLHVRTFKLANERAVALEHGNVEPVAVAVADQHVTGVADVDAVRVVGDVLTADAVKELAVLREHHDTVTLPDNDNHTQKHLQKELAVLREHHAVTLPDNDNHTQKHLQKELAVLREHHAVTLPDNDNHTQKHLQN